MKRFALSLLALPVLFCCGCAVELTQQGWAVQVADENIVRQCKYLGDVTGESTDAATSRNDVRNQAASLGATHVVFVSQTPPVSGGPTAPDTPAEAMARAYSCPAQAASPAHQ
jgi:hypothetical protein